MRKYTILPRRATVDSKFSQVVGRLEDLTKQVWALSAGDSPDPIRTPQTRHASGAVCIVAVRVMSHVPTGRLHRHLLRHSLLSSRILFQQLLKQPSPKIAAGEGCMHPYTAVSVTHLQPSVLTLLQLSGASVVTALSRDYRGSRGLQRGGRGTAGGFRGATTCWLLVCW